MSPAAKTPGTLVALTGSAVITGPSGLISTGEERSQAMNRKLALARLAAMLADGASAAKAEAERDRWAQHDALDAALRCAPSKGSILGSASNQRTSLLLRGGG